MTKPIEPKGKSSAKTTSKKSKLGTKLSKKPEVKKKAKARKGNTLKKDKGILTKKPSKKPVKLPIPETINDAMELSCAELLTIMTDKQRMFCKEYQVDRNGTQAAIRAGYSKDSARQVASDTMAKTYVRAYIEKILAQQSIRLDVSADRVIQEIAKMAYSNMEDYVSVKDGSIVGDLSTVTRDQMACVQEFTTEVNIEFDKDGNEVGKIRKSKFKLVDKKASLKMLGDYNKLFVQKLELSGKDGAPLISLITGMSAEQKDDVLAKLDELIGKEDE